MRSTRCTHPTGLIRVVGTALPLLAMLWVAAASADLGPYPVRDMELPAPHEIGPPVFAADPSLPTSPPPDPQVGDSWRWWLFIHVGMPHFEERNCTVRGRSDHGYIVVEDSQWEVNIFQEDVDALLDRWENSSIGIHPDMGIYDINSYYFGAPPDAMDDDERIYQVWFDFGNTSDGFFFWFDQEPDGANPPYRSNECETVYLNTANGQDPASDYMIAVTAHEFEHMIHWNYDVNEFSWVDEGLAEFAMWLYGHPDQISQFNSNPDNQLTQWNGTWADYIKTYLWTLYFYENYGGRDAVYAVVHEPANSNSGYDLVLDDMGYTEDFADVFADWVVANYLDDPSLADGRFGYEGDDLPPFSVAGSFSSYPVLNQTRTVNHWAADYYRFTGFGEFSNIDWEFDGSDNNVFAVWCLALRGDGATDVLRMTIDPSTQTGTLPVVGLTHPDDEVILVVASTSTFGTTSYVFSAIPNLAAVGEGFATSIFSATPNPSRGSVEFRLPGSGPARIEVFDAQGRCVWQPPETTSPALLWDGSRLAPGVYYARLSRNGRTEERELILLR